MVMEPRLITVLKPAVLKLGIQMEESTFGVTTEVGHGQMPKGTLKHGMKPIMTK